MNTSATPSACCWFSWATVRKPHFSRAENLRAPVGQEGIAFPRRECGHAQRDCVPLMLEEDREVFICNVAQDHQESPVSASRVTSRL
jgi:hypothetical protein